jgi:hypothetical protein
MTIDCDLHMTWKDFSEVMPYASRLVKDRAETAGYVGFEFPTYPWPNPSGFHRQEAIDDAGGRGGSDYETTRKQLLDPLDLEYAILSPEDIAGAAALVHEELASDLCRAHNRWMIDTWLSLGDPRLKGSIFVAPQDPAAAAAEIRELGGHPDIVRVQLAMGSQRGFGHPFYHPIWEAAEEVGLPVALHPDAHMGINPPPTATGMPTYYVEHHTLLATVAMSHLVSFITHGVFEKYPGLTVALIEGGVAWVPAILWRLDNNWKSMRREIPWVRELPSEIARRHVRLTTQPLEGPADPRQLKQAFEAFPPFQEMLMFSTDYPHWDAESPDLIARRLPSGWADAVMSENARAHYGLPA